MNSRCNIGATHRGRGLCLPTAPDLWGEDQIRGGAHLVKRRIDKHAPPMPKWVLHDIRRTVASGMARLGINIAVVEKLLNT
jgi:hypothetical protein